MVLVDGLVVNKSNPSPISARDHHQIVSGMLRRKACDFGVETNETTLVAYRECQQVGVDYLPMPA